MILRTARKRLTDSVLILSLVLGALLALVAIFGIGLDTRVFGIRLSSRGFWRSALAVVVSSLLLLKGSEPRQRKLERVWSQISQHAVPTAIVLGALTTVIAIRASPFEASAADVYGYVSQAHLWAAGHLVENQPLSLRAPWPDPESTFSPLGYRPGLQPGTIVPTYPPGLPLAMAGSLMAFGKNGPFFVVPLLGGLAIMLALLLGRQVGGGACGTMSAALILTSPAFLFHLKEPMSDVPVTAWWLLAIALASSTKPVAILLGGMAAAAAVMTRPNLLPLAAVLGIFVLLYSSNRWRVRLANAALFAAGVAPGCVAVALVNAHLYGSPLSSGYGDVFGIFNGNYFWTNLLRYSRWLLDTETPMILLAPVGWFLLRRREASPEGVRFGTSGRWSNLFVAFSTVLLLSYAFYLPFDNWTYLRFLLPAIALLWLLCAVALSELGSRLPSLFSKCLLAGFIVLFAAWRWDAIGLKPLPPNERRFAVVGEYVQDTLPPNAIVFAQLHAGSIRYYSGRLTLRWDLLPPDWLDRSIAFVTSAGYRPYLLVERGWEREQFLERFSGHSSLGSLELTPLATYHGGEQADLYDLASPVQPMGTATISSRSVAP